MHRDNMLQQLKLVPEWDIVIVGGGATGLGAAVDAASRGYKTLLVEQADFAKGTSGRSTKLVHGGVRYLAQGNVKLVREALRERGLLLKNAPHVCHNMSFIIPSFHWWQKWWYGIGLSLYELLSGKLSLGKTKLLSGGIARQLLPTVKPALLGGGVLYSDGQFNDARLAINLAQTAVEQGATVINYCRLTALTKTGTRISGASVIDTCSGNIYEVRCKVLVNATGVFTDEVMKLDNASHQPMVTPSRGVHLVVDPQFFPGNHAMMIPATDDGRILFAVPWLGKVVLGTTDSPVATVTSEPLPVKAEVDFILSHINRYLAADIRYRDVRSMFAGLRPLIKIPGKKSTALLPRDHTTMVSDSGMVTITGGKWTTYRTMGKHVIDMAAKTASLPPRPCTTETLKIHGYTTENAIHNPLTEYGCDAAAMQQLMEDNPSLGEKLHGRLPYQKVLVTWAIRNEMAITVEDVLARRTRALVLDAAAAIEMAPGVAAMMAGELNKDSDWEQQQVAGFTLLATDYLVTYT